ncbi:MAG: hypothetical protein AB8I08_15915 [Sandaracinaceae bacterium]
MSNRAMSASLLVAACLALAALAGCDTTLQDMDAAVRLDATAEEGGLVDGGATPSDSGPAVPDASLSDAGAPLCTWTTCDPRAAEGCGDDSCVLRGEAAVCDTEPGMLGRDAECTTVSDCAPGLACFLVEGRGSCGRICCPEDETACGEDATCGGSGVLVDGTATSWGRCRPRARCDVHTPAEACEDREGCYIIDGVGTTECRVAGEGEAGAACELQEDCTAGYFCGGVGSMKQCVRICRIGEDDCGEREACVAQVHTPDGSGLCATDTTAFRERR